MQINIMDWFTFILKKHLRYLITIKVKNEHRHSSYLPHIYLVIKMFHLQMIHSHFFLSYLCFFLVHFCFLFGLVILLEFYIHFVADNFAMKKCLNWCLFFEDIMFVNFLCLWTDFLYILKFIHYFGFCSLAYWI